MKGPSKFAKGQSPQYQLAMIKTLEKMKRRHGIHSYFMVPTGWIINGKYISFTTNKKFKRNIYYSNRSFYIPTAQEVEDNRNQLRQKRYYKQSK